MQEIFVRKSFTEMQAPEGEQMGHTQKGKTNKEKKFPSEPRTKCVKGNFNEGEKGAFIVK